MRSGGRGERRALKTRQADTNTCESGLVYSSPLA